MRADLASLLVYADYDIRQVLEQLNIGAKGIVLVVDQQKKLVGTITDGDVRRALLQGLTLTDPINKVIHYEPVHVTATTSREEIKEIFIKKAVRQLPVVDEEGILVDLISINEVLVPEGKDNLVVIMAGGLGTRLKTLTHEIPKPMLKVGNDPILQHIIVNFRQYGYNKMIMTVNYKAEIIENYFQDGYAYGVNIKYIKEKKRLGTAGGIRLAQAHLEKPFFVINGDIFTNLNMEKLMNFHLEKKWALTVGTKNYSFQIPYGVLETEGKKVTGVREKPELQCLINGGVYCLNPEVINLIPENSYFEITDLINTCLDKGLPVGSYEIQDYWMDIGRQEDYYQLNNDYLEIAAAKE